MSREFILIRNHRSPLEITSNRLAFCSALFFMEHNGSLPAIGIEYGKGMKNYCYCAELNAILQSFTKGKIPAQK
jgi:hypothetical protein